MTIHPQRKRLDAAHHEVTIERRWHATGGVLEERQPLGQFVEINRENPAHHVAVPAQILRRRVNDDVCPER